MTLGASSDIDTRSALEVFSRAFCRAVIAFEHRLRTAPDGTASAADTPGLGVLVALDAFGPLRPVTITGLLGMTTGGATKVVDRLERRGLVQRHEGAVPGDRRAVVVGITDAGRRAIASADRELRALAGDMADAITALLGPGPTPAPAPSGAAVTALYGFFGPADAAVVEAIDGSDVLKPGDPRGVLVLLEVAHGGPLALNAVPPLIDRSRAATHRLVAALVREGLVARQTAPHDRRLVRLAASEHGRVVATRILDSLGRHRPAWEPPAATLAAALTAPAAVPAGA